MSRTRLFEWHRRFKEGREEVEDDHRNGRPSANRTDENVERVRLKVQSNRRVTARMIAHELGINIERVWRIITEYLGMRKISAKMVPRLLNEGQKERRVQVCQDILEQLKTEPNSLKELLLAMSHGSSRTIHSPNGRVSKSKTKMMLIAFLMSMELYMQNSCNKTKLLISTSTKTSCNI